MEETGFDMVVQEYCRVPVMVRHFLEEETGLWRGCSRGLLSVSVTVMFQALSGDGSLAYGCSRGLLSARNVIGTEWRRGVIDLVVQEDCRMPV